MNWHSSARRAVRAAVAPAMMLGLVPTALQAQRPSRSTRVLAGVELGVLHSNRRLGSEGISIGGVVGVERQMTSRASARATLGLAETSLTTEVMPSCLPDTLCSAGGTFPIRVGSLEVHGIVAPFDALPVSSLAGGGLALPIGVRRQVSITEHREHDRALKGVARVGAQIPLGLSTRAPRLQVTRAWLSGAFDALDRSDTFSLVFVF